MTADGAARDAALRNLVERALGWADEHDGIMPIVAAGDPVLRTPADTFDGQLEDALLCRLIDSMRATMKAAPGVGLAAPQVGIPLRLAVLEDSAPVDPDVALARERTPLPFRVIVNPSYTAIGAREASFYEGCLSVPGYQAVVNRSAAIRLQGFDERGEVLDEEVTGWPARIVAHETDHLDGILYLDRAETRSLATHQAVAGLWDQPSPEHAAGALGFRLGSGRRG
ncbi:peptide deformylase [Saxibacter everestensis]|uniref:Peptide deformylase n=1 Tax=Saxibacter everestensis TaxID=2909229 RepID=A0ABY8QQB2_9MICO|nr:peptide deformylase [Brevibacteriaceae bacterium ZFBP1038]